MTKKIYLHTFGCKVNQYESQAYLEKFERYGYEPTEDVAKADVILVNSCTVTAEADRQCRQLLRKMAKQNPSARLIVSGCYPKRSRDEVGQISDKIEILPSLKDISGIFKDELPEPESKPITGFFEHTRAFVKIQDGCNNFCSYCIVPYVRPKMWSKPLADASSEIKNLVLAGYPEIVLTGVHIGKYEYGLTALINTIKNFEGSYRIRLSSIELGDVTDELVAAMAADGEKICCHLHIPLQSGSNRILKLMRRPYTTEMFSEKLKRIRKVLPGVNITTDVITGFPGESEADHNETREFIMTSEFGKLHVFRYSKRPGTDACGYLGQVDAEDAKKRAAGLRALDKALQERFLDKALNTKRQVLLENSSTSVLTDNYIKLPFSGTKEADGENLFYANIARRNGKITAL